MFFLRDEYINSVLSYGCMPLLLPYGGIPKLDGVILPGGRDISPRLYGEENNGSFGIDLRHDLFEIALCRHCLRNRIPLLGICRGIQIMAVACGGRLKQHVDLHLSDYGRSLHRVKITRPLFTLSGEITVNSLHHQSVLDPGTLSVFALSDDGEIEGIYSPAERFFAGVQWHPERMKSLCQHRFITSFFDECVRSRRCLPPGKRS